MKTLCASVLIFESIVILLAIPVAVVVAPGGVHVSAGVGISGGIALVIVCIYLAMAQRTKSWALVAGWIMQLVLLLTGFIVPMMFFLGIVFGVLWFYAIRLGRHGDAIKVDRDAQVAAREGAQAGT